MGTFKQENKDVVFLDPLLALRLLNRYDGVFEETVSSYWFAPAVSMFGRCQGWIALRNSLYVPCGNTKSYVKYT